MKTRRLTDTGRFVVETDNECRLSGYESRWNVPVAEVSTEAEVQRIHAEYEKAVKHERYFL
jgi:TPP-dependent trihydroxycyclohexane-1,2-dione (THcHDO) dehydratase